MNPPAPVRLLAALDVDYAAARAWQDAAAAEVRAARAVPAAASPGDPAESLALIEHAAVYTMGARGGRETLRTPVEALRAPLLDTDRGGDITWHGPGQLVAYPILDLRARGLGAAEYIAGLEGMLLDTLAEFGIAAGLVEGRRGVWVGREKIAALGIGVRGGVSLHGVALNVCPDLGWFDAIVPCGIEDAGVTSMTRVLGRTVRVAEARRTMLHAFERRFGSRCVTVTCDVARQALGAGRHGVRQTRAAVSA